MSKLFEFEDSSLLNIFADTSHNNQGRYLPATCVASTEGLLLDPAVSNLTTPLAGAAQPFAQIGSLAEAMKVAS